jgi:hypothetical protein
MNTNLKWMDQQFDRALQGVSRTVREFPWEDAQAYAGWLAQTYYFVRQTTTLLAVKAGIYGPDAFERHQEVLQHLREENGHPQMLLRDLKALGCAIDQFPELIETSLFYQSQYYWLERRGPLAFVGYSMMLEELAVREGKGVGEKILTTHGKTAASFLLLHTKADVDHCELQRRELESASRAELEWVVRNLEQSAFLYAAILDRVSAACAASRGRQARKAA